MKNEHDIVFEAITGKSLTMKEIHEETDIPMGSIKLYISKASNYGKSIDRVKVGQIFSYQVIDETWMDSTKKVQPESLSHFNLFMKMMDSCITKS